MPSTHNNNPKPLPASQLAQPVHVPGLEEIERQFQTEFDYRKEADNMNVIRYNLARFQAEVTVPRALAATENVLVMEEVRSGSEERTLPTLRKAPR